MAVKKISVSKLRTHCCAVVAEVERTGKPIYVTKFGEVIVKIRPPRAKRRST